MNTKQLGVLAGVVFAVSKFYFGHETRTSLILAASAIGTAAVVDNILPR